MVESEWITEEFKLAIKQRNQFNQEKRHCKVEDKQHLVAEWERQRAKVHQLVRDLKGSWEAKKTKEARDSRDHGKTVWRVVRELQGKIRSDEKAFVYMDGYNMTLRMCGTRWLKAGLISFKCGGTVP